PRIGSTPTVKMPASSLPSTTACSIVTFSRMLRASLEASESSLQDGDVRNVPRGVGRANAWLLTNRGWSRQPAFFENRPGLTARQQNARPRVQGAFRPVPAGRLTVCRARSYQDDRALLGCPYTLARDECRIAPLLTGTKMLSESVG